MKYKSLSSNLEILHSQGGSHEVLSNRGWLGSYSCSIVFLFEAVLFMFCLLHLILPLWASVFIDFIFWDLSYDMQSIISLSLLLPRSTKLQLNWTQLTLTLFLSIHPTTYPSMFSKLIITTQKQIEIHV